MMTTSLTAKTAILVTIAFACGFGASFILFAPRATEAESHPVPSLSRGDRVEDSVQEAREEQVGNQLPAGVTVPPGHKAIVVPRAPEIVCCGGSAALVGRHVRVSTVVRHPDGSTEARVLRDNVLVLADDLSQEQDASGRYMAKWSATLAVKEEDVPLFEALKKLGRVTLLLPRFNPRPELIAPPPPVEDAPPRPPTANESASPVVISGMP
jgi:hypothetical protein